MAFAFCFMITSIEFPVNLEILRGNAFRYCNLSQTFTITSKMTELYFDSFIGSKMEFEVDPDVTIFKLYNGCIYNENYTTLLAVSYSVKVITYHPNVTEFGLCCFSSSTIDVVKVPEKVNKLAKYALHRTPYITTIVLPSCLTVIKEAAISELPNLKQLIIQEEILSISQNAFYDLPNLIQVTLPSSATVAMSAFWLTNNIKFAIFNNTNKIDEYVRAGIPRRAFRLDHSCDTYIRFNYNFVPFLSVLLD